jgi:hypothetical protein
MTEPYTHPIGFIDTIAPGNIDLHATYRMSYEISRIYIDDASFKEHVEYDLALQMAAIIKEQMDVFWRTLPGGETEVEANIRVLNTTQWRDLESQLFERHFNESKESYTNAWLSKQKLSLIPFGIMKNPQPVIALPLCN